MMPFVVLDVVVGGIGLVWWFGGCLCYQLIWAMCIAVGAIVAFVGIRNLIRAKASMAWPTTQGKVLSSSVVTLHDS
jgi:hypothetical protein